METKSYTDALDNASESTLLCRCCGRNPYVLSKAADTMCTFCEAYVNEDGENAVKGDTVVMNALEEMQESASRRAWENGVVHAEALAASNNPYLIFGAAAFYRAYSDFVYMDVDYGMPGFMYANAANRSDESSKNSHNSMALISRSKGLLFRLIKIVNDTHDADAQLRFMAFMANIQLGRVFQAARHLSTLNGPACPEAIRNYANMVYAQRVGGKDTQKYVDACFGMGIANAAYYMARHLAVSGNLADAIRISERFAVIIDLPASLHFNKWLNEVNASSGI